MIIPAGPLMREHRLIEKMIVLMAKERDRISKDNRPDPAFVDVVVDFLRTYADRCHHGKEEDILFRDLAKKKLTPEHKKMMVGLIADHVFARKTVGELVAAKEKYVKGESRVVRDIIECMNKLVDLYPRHIKTEDKDFFLPCMKYFTQPEQAAMVQEFWDFDKTLIHERYGKIVETLEAGFTIPASRTG